MPPFIFRDLHGSNLEVQSVEIREGCSIQKVKWTISNGNFTYIGDEGTVIAGKVSKFTLKGKMSRPDSPCGYLLEIGPGGLKFKLKVSEPFAFQAFGGMITVSKDGEIQISNDRPINISRFKPVTSNQSVQVNQVGSLTLSTSERLAWQDVRFSFSELSEPISLTLTAPDHQKKRFELPFDSNRVRVTDANFVFEVPPDLPTRHFELNGPKYRARVKDTHLETLTVGVSGSGLLLRVHNLSVFGQLTVRSDAAPKTPILFNGTASVNNASSSAAYSFTAAQMKDVRFSGLRLIPIPPDGVSDARGVRSSMELPSTKWFAIGHGFNTPADNKLSSAPEPLQAILNPCVRIPIEQINDIKKLGLPLLSDQQFEAIRKSQEALDRFESPDFLIHLPTKGLTPLLEKLGSNLGQKLNIVFGNQLVTFCADLSTTTPIPITLKLTLSIAPSFEVVTIVKDDKPKDVLGLILRYEVSIAHMGTVDESKEGNFNDVLGAINQILASANSSAGAITSKVAIPIDLDFVKLLDPHREGKDDDTGDTYEVRGRKIETSISPVPEMTVLLIDGTGMHVLGKVKVAVKVVN
jgi:hypothetical protein